MRRRGFTLIELMVAISISLIIMGAMYFSLTSALESWHYARDQLALQQVVSEVLEEMQEGTDWGYGLRATLEIAGAEETAVAFVPPWTEEHPAPAGHTSLQLTQYVKPGAGLPTAEFRLPDSQLFRPLPVTWEEPDNRTDRPRIRPGFELVPGSTVRLSYHPDPDRVPEALVTLRWDPATQAVYRDAAEGTHRLGQNPFGVTITDCHFRYYDQLGALVGQGSDVPIIAWPLVTAVEITLTGRLADHTLTLVGMVMLRNSPRQSGLVILRPGLQVPIPDSHKIRTLLLTNLVGVDHEDEIQLEARPRTGKIWRVTLRFERRSGARPVMAQVTVEYPPGQPVFTDRPRTPADLGLNLLALDPGGLYDYDDDPQIEDVVMVEGEPVILVVTKMDVAGAALFVQP